MANITFRQATPDDHKSLRELEQRLIEAERPFDPTLKKGDILYYNMAELITASHIRLVVAESEGRIISTGYGRIEKAKERYAHDRYLYVGFIYTDPVFRGQGLYEKIIEQLKDFAAANGISEMRLEVYAENQMAIRAYRKIGFEGYSLEMRLKI
jgi:ribosomal protein S18 acetylase RimI-like enzyme